MDDVLFIACFNLIFVRLAFRPLSQFTNRHSCHFTASSFCLDNLPLHTFIAPVTLSVRVVYERCVEEGTTLCLTPTSGPRSPCNS
jgi:hypothetical protein